MKRRTLSLILTFVMVLGMLPTVALAAPAQSGGLYQIGTADDLLWFAQEVNGGNTAIKAVLKNNIDLSGVSDWPGIGTESKPFAGTFDGGGFTVTFQEAQWGLFGYIMGTENSLVSIANVTTAGSVNRSAFAHSAGYVHFQNCINRATVTVNSSTRTGGILGVVSGTNKYSQIHSDVRFTNCGNEASVTGLSFVGGILGHNSGAGTKLDGCYNTGNIHGSSDVGGLVGYLQGSTGDAQVKNSYNTGRITGGENVGGIVGYMKNGGKVDMCYNSGSSTYAITGNRYNNTATINNSFFLGTMSAKCSPDYTETMHFNDNTYEILTRAKAVSAAEMATSEFANLLGSAFKQSCPTPVLSYQTASGHSGSPCDKCHYGSTVKEVYDVTFQQHDGYTLKGADKATQGSAYSFTLTINEGYEAASGHAVKVNGETVTAASNGKYTVTNVQGPISVTVLNVTVIPGNHSISLPGNGNGYRAVGEKTVKRDENYTFTISFVDGFKAGKNFKVIAQEVLPQSELDKGTVPEEKEVTGTNGTYTVSKVQKDYRILVSGVEAVPTADPITVNFTVTEGKYEFHETKNYDEPIVDRTMEVPYFDLSLYGLERYYYNPYCYKDEAGNIRNIQKEGNAESAYNQITVMHAFIVATEMFYLGYDNDEVGKGTLYASDPAAFEQIISWSQNAGSSFMNFWDHGTNLNYYVNYEYPLAYPGWGSTSDQIKMKDGDIISVHLITGQGSGSGFGFFTANDTNTKYNLGTDVVNEITVDQGEKVKLTYFWTSTTGSYKTKYTLQKNKQLYWIDADYDGILSYMPPQEPEDVDANGRPIYGWDQYDNPIYKPSYEGWHTEDLGKNVLKTDSSGQVTIDTAGLEPGTYYIGGVGGFSEGGQADDAGFVSAGSETGPAFFKLVVKEYNGKLGDVNGDTQITTRDAAYIQRYVANLESEINPSVADVNGDGQVTTRDAAMIRRFVAGLITSFTEKS